MALAPRSMSFLYPYKPPTFNGSLLPHTTLTRPRPRRPRPRPRPRETLARWHKHPSSSPCGRTLSCSESRRRGDAQPTTEGLQRLQRIQELGCGGGLRRLERKEGRKEGRKQPPQKAGLGEVHQTFLSLWLSDLRPKQGTKTSPAPKRRLRPLPRLRSSSQTLVFANARPLASPPS